MFGACTNNKCLSVSSSLSNNFVNEHPELLADCVDAHANLGLGCPHMPLKARSSDTAYLTLSTLGNIFQQTIF